jgi:hypothetical protein
MARIEQPTHEGAAFAGSATGPADGPVVILPHGRPEDRPSWDRLAAPLGAGAGPASLAGDRPTRRLSS